MTDSLVFILRDLRSVSVSLEHTGKSLLLKTLALAVLWVI